MLTNDTNLVSLKKRRYMNLINRDTDYALRALLYIENSEKDLVPVSDIIKDLQIPRAFLRKSLQVLGTKGILHSKKGKDGGFSLSRPAKEITLIEVIEAFQGDFSLNECIFKKKICPEKKTCVIRKKIQKIEDIVEDRLKNITISSLIKEA